ncbi:MAG: DUF1559 domain-containing protein [Pirellulaceae bacterium]
MPRRTGFTLVELLVVIAIIGALVALLLPAVQQAREAARRMQCTNHLKQVTLALHNYEGTFRVYPPGRMACDGGDPDCTPQNGPSSSALLMLLPFLEQGNLYDQCGEYGFGPDNSFPGVMPESILNTRPSTFVCPSDTSEPFYLLDNKRWATTSYAMVSGHFGPSQGAGARAKWDNSGMFVYRDSKRQADARDGLSNVLFTGEVIDSHAINHINRWIVGTRHLDTLRSTENPINQKPGTGLFTFAPHGEHYNGAFGSRHPGGANFGIGDGSVRFLAETIDLDLYRLLGQRNSGLPKAWP